MNETIELEAIAEATVVGVTKVWAHVVAVTIATIAIADNEENDVDGVTIILPSKSDVFWII